MMTTTLNPALPRQELQPTILLSAEETELVGGGGFWEGMIGGAIGFALGSIFIERGVSGSKPLGERPEGARLLAGLKAGDVGSPEVGSHVPLCLGRARCPWAT
jgi:hypothetical protein